MSDRLGNQRGFMIVETFIAVVIVIIISVAAVYAIQGSSHVLTRNSIAEQQYEIAQRALDEIKTDRELQRRCNNLWNKQDPPGSCAVQADLGTGMGVYRDDEGRIYLVDRTIEPIDDAGDDTSEPMWDEAQGSRAVNDFDHNFNTRDYYHATVTVRLSDGSLVNTGQAAGTYPKVTLAGRIWFSGLDNKERGTIYITICEHYRKDRSAMTVRCRDSNVAYSNDPGSPYYRQGPFCDASGRCGFAPSIPQARVHLRRVDNERQSGEPALILSGSTDNFGFVTVPDVPPGDYRVEKVDLPPTKRVPFTIAYTIPTHIHVQPGSVQEVHVTMAPTPVDLEVCFNMTYRLPDGSWPLNAEGNPRVIPTDYVTGNAPKWYNDPLMGIGNLTGRNNQVAGTNFLWKERGSPVYRARFLNIDTQSGGGNNCRKVFNDPLGYSADRVFTSQFFFEVETVRGENAAVTQRMDIGSVYAGDENAPGDCRTPVKFYRSSVASDAASDRVRWDFWPDHRFMTDKRFAYTENGASYDRETVVFQFDMIENTPLNKLCINFVSRAIDSSAGAAPYQPPPLIGRDGTILNGNNVRPGQTVVNGG